MHDVGYLTSNANTAWPFYSDDPSLDRRVSRLFADGSVLVYPEDGADGASIRNVSVEDGVLSFTVEKTKGTEPLSSVRMEIRAGAGVYAVSSASWCFFVAECHEILDAGGLSAEGPFRIDPAACGMEPERVTSISLYNHEPGSSDVSLTEAGIRGDVKIVGGYNVYVGQDMSNAGFIKLPEEISGVDGVVIAAGAGLGAGTVPCDGEQDQDGDWTGNVRPDSEGNVVIEPDRCYQISPDEHRYYQVVHRKTSQAYLENVHLLLQGRCTACCQCDDFVETNDRLADQSRLVLQSYNSLIESSSVYNDKATRFNSRVKQVDTDKLVARLVVMGQSYNHGGEYGAHSQSLKRISGSVDRAQAVVSLKNMSANDVTAFVTMTMEPQPLVMANILTPNGTGDTWTTVNNEVVGCSGSFTRGGIQLPAGSGVTIRLYGARGGTYSPSSYCLVNGYVIFSWKEEIECPEDPSNDWPDFSNDSNDLEWHTAFDVDSNDGVPPDYTAHFGDFLPEYNFVEHDVDLSLDSNDSNDTFDGKIVPILPDESGKCWTAKSFRRQLTVRQET